jgi:L-asparaginase
MSQEKRKILLIYTGGTIGMAVDPFTNALRPFDFHRLKEQIPELDRFNLALKVISFKEPIDSSNMNPNRWHDIAKLIEMNYELFEGFVILHGSDTMAYTASALSFMLKGLNKPVILTGSQLPMGQLRTDGRENLITAIEIAAATKNQCPRVPEVAVLFEDELYRGNRTHKINTEYFEAFDSPNYHILAKVGVNIKYYDNFILPYKDDELVVNYDMDCSLQVLFLYPGISKEAVKAILNTPNLKGVVLKTFGSGNAPTDEWFVELLKKAIDKGVMIYNVTQCEIGSVKPGMYETSKKLEQIGVLNGADILIEAALTKFMHLLGQNYNRETIINGLVQPIRGEMTV